MLPRHAGTNNNDCAGIVVQDNTTVCRLVNDSAVTVATVLEGASLRRRRVGFTLQPNVTHSFWIDVAIPKTAGPGNYTGNISVTCTGAHGNGMGTTASAAPVAMDNSAAPASESASAVVAPASPILTVGVSMEVWPIAAECIELQASKYGKAWGFDHPIVGQLQPNKTSGAAAVAEAEVAEFMCVRHTPAEALASSWAVERPLADIRKLLAPPCSQPYFNAAFLGIANGPPSPANITPAYVNATLNRIAPRMEELKAAGLLSRGYIYAFDESHVQYKPAVALLWGEVKRRWPQVRTLSVLNWAVTPDLPVDIWVIQYQMLDDPATRAAADVMQAAGREVWGYHCISPIQPVYLNTFLDVPLMKARLIPWFSAAHGLDGWLYWYTNWGSRHAPSAIDNAMHELVPVRAIQPSGAVDYDPQVYGFSKDAFTNEDGNLMCVCRDGAATALAGWCLPTSWVVCAPRPLRHQQLQHDGLLEAASHPRPRPRPRPHPRHTHTHTHALHMFAPLHALALPSHTGTCLRMVRSRPCGLKIFDSGLKTGPSSACWAVVLAARPACWSVGLPTTPSMQRCWTRRGRGWRARSAQETWRATTCFDCAVPPLINGCIIYTRV